VLPFELSDSGLLGDISQFAPSFIMLRLEPAGVSIGVARAGGVGIAGRPRGVAWHGRSRDRHRSGVPLDEPGNTKRIVRNKRKSIKSVRKLTITTSGERQRGSPRLRRWPGACCCCLPLGFWGH
jgi:hypothetical protein